MNPVFNSAKIKLTGLYLAIIMFVTISFSFFIFSGVNQATERALEIQKVKFERQVLSAPPEFRRVVIFDPIKADAVLEIRKRVLYTLILVNIGVLVVSGGLGYYLAEKTLKPIEDMLSKQKRFLSDAAHELKTPLTGIKTDLEVTLRDKDLTLDESRKTLKRTIESVNDLSELTKGLLLASKYTNSDIYNKATESINLDALITDVISKFSAKAKKKNIVIKPELESVKVEADRLDIEKIVMNLLDNAIKYSNKNAFVEISLGLEGNKAIMKFKDNGKGIKSSELELVFEPFYRSEKSRTQSRVEGYGLGLAITKDIIESYGGSIEVESKYGKGSVFTAILPANLK